MAIDNLPIPARSEKLFPYIFQYVRLILPRTYFRESLGSRKFLSFYLGCGVAGGLFFMLLVAVKFLNHRR